jgi:hypothetical protein
LRAIGRDATEVTPTAADGRTPVLYIAGYGRSGSTLLDLLLGRIDGWFSMGEFRLVWYARRDGWRCACGEKVTDCEIWSQVFARAGDVDDRRALSLVKTMVRTRRVPGLLSPHLAGGHRAELDELRSLLGSLYDAAAQVSGARVLVDSSKDPVYGLVLAGIPSIRLHVVHLVRDSRAVAWSWQRRRLRPEIGTTDAYMPVRSPARTSLDWDLRNGIAHVLGRRAASYTRLTYESFVRDPDAVVETIARRIDPDTQVAIGASTGAAVNHTVAGNPMRFEGTAVEVKPDTEWQTALGARDRRVVTALTWPLQKVYGYGAAGSAPSDSGAPRD